MKIQTDIAKHRKEDQRISFQITETCRMIEKEVMNMKKWICILLTVVLIPVLASCGMSEIHPANPHEAFILICILSDCPMAVYGDIWELSYEQ